MVSVRVSKFDCSSLILLDIKVKIYVICYCSLLLPQQLLPVLRQVPGKFRNSDDPVTQCTGHANINILQGSVATRLRCGGIFNKSFIANFLQIVLAKEYLKSVNIW